MPPLEMEFRDPCGCRNIHSLKQPEDVDRANYNMPEQVFGKQDDDNSSASTRTDISIMLENALMRTFLQSGVPRCKTAEYSFHTPRLNRPIQPIHV